MAAEGWKHSLEFQSPNAEGQWAWVVIWERQWPVTQSKAGWKFSGWRRREPEEMENKGTAEKPDCWRRLRGKLGACGSRSCVADRRAGDHLPERAAPRGHSSLVRLLSAAGGGASGRARRESPRAWGWERCCGGTLHGPRTTVRWAPSCRGQHARTVADDKCPPALMPCSTPNWDPPTETLTWLRWTFCLMAEWCSLKKRS